MNNNHSLPGRPAGRKKTAKIEVVIEPQIKEEFMQILSDEGKNASGEIGLWIRNYIKSVKYENGGVKKWELFLCLAALVDWIKDS